MTAIRPLAKKAAFLETAGAAFARIISVTWCIISNTRTFALAARSVSFKVADDISTLEITRQLRLLLPPSTSQLTLPSSYIDRYLSQGDSM